MNLIEQLGGYDQAKEILHGCALYGRHDVRVPVVGGFIHIVTNFLEQDLLQYRREHNIFEVGDWVVMLSDTVKKEWEFYQLTLDDMGSHWVSLVEFRHATDEEIQAGRRI